MIFEQLRTELGYADYRGALQRYRAEYPRDPHLLTVSHVLVNYPFANRLFPDALDVLEHVKPWGPAVIPVGRRCRLSTTVGSRVPTGRVQLSQGSVIVTTNLVASGRVD